VSGAKHGTGQGIICWLLYAKIGAAQISANEHHNLAALIFSKIEQRRRVGQSTMDLILRRPRSLRGRLERWLRGTDSRPSFETHRCAMLLRMRLMVDCRRDISQQARLHFFV
jgi:hypothetical protein